MFWQKIFSYQLLSFPNLHVEAIGAVWRRGCTKKDTDKYIVKEIYIWVVLHCTFIYYTQKFLYKLRLSSITPSWSCCKFGCKLKCLQRRSELKWNIRRFPTMMATLTHRFVKWNYYSNNTWSWFFIVCNFKSTSVWNMWTYWNSENFYGGGNTSNDSFQSILYNMSTESCMNDLCLHWWVHTT